MRVGYGKLGRSFSLRYDGASSVGGDIEVIRLLRHLRENHEVHLVGPNRADAVWENVTNHYAPGGVLGHLPTVTNDQRYPQDPGYLKFMRILEHGVQQLPELDAVVLWLGQHGTASSFIPSVMADSKNDPRLPAGVTRPLMSLVNYVYPLLHYLNRRRIRPIWLCPDPRNKLKARDLADPRQRIVLAQYDGTRDNLFYDPETMLTHEGVVTYSYAGIELLVVERPEESRDAYEAGLRSPSESSFGLVANESYSNINNSRLSLAIQWLSGLPDGWELHGSWTVDSQRRLGRAVTTVPVMSMGQTLRRWRSTITFPATNSGWATAKPWECFSAGTVCFRHPLYDDQNHIYGPLMSPELRSFLSPKTPEELHAHVALVARDDELWRKIVEEQRRYFERRYEDLQGGALFVERAIEMAAFDY